MTMSAPVGTVFTQDHPRLNLTPIMLSRPNFRDGKRWSLPMPEFEDVSKVPLSTPGGAISATNGDMATLMENLQNKKTSSASSLLNRQAAAVSTSSSSTTAAAFSTLSAASATSTSEKHTSSSTAQMVTTSSHSASASSSRVSSSSKRSQLMTHSMSASEMNLKQATSSSTTTEKVAENRNFDRSMSLGGGTTPSVLKLAGGPQRVFSVDRMPITEEPIPVVEEMSSSLVPVMPGGGVGGGTATATGVSSSSSATTTSTAEVKFEQKQQMSASKMTVTTADGFSSEKEARSKQEMKRIQAADFSMEESRAASAVKAKLETEGFSAEKSAAVMEAHFQMKSGEMTQEEQRMAQSASMSVSTGNFLATAMQAKQAERQTISTHGVTQATRMASSSSSTSKMTFSSAKDISTSSQSSRMLSTQVTSGMLGCDWEKKFSVDMHDLDLLSASSGQEEVSQVITKYSTMMGEFVENLKSSVKSTDEAAGMLRVMGHVMHRAWAVPTHGNTMGYELCDVMRKTGGLDLLIQNCGATTDDVDDVQFSSARVLEQCLTTDNRNYVVKNGLEEVVSTARSCVIHKKTLEHARVGTGILAHLFKHSEMTCSDVMKMGGLKAVLQQCRESDLETLRHCASAIANLSLYGDSENHQAMINSQVQFWLFPLVVNPDDNIKYYSCLAVAALVANKEIEASVDKSGTLKCVEQFVTSHDPADFARSSVAHVHGQSKEWLQRLVPVLNSKRSEACSLAAFHFAMEAGIKKNQGKTDIFLEIGAIEALKKVASSPNAIASKLAAQALQIIGERIPHKLSQQVPLWTVEDVIEWLKQIGFTGYSQEFMNSRVDGDLLLKLTESMLLDDIGIKNGILRKRFMRELGNLKKTADYSSCDTSSLNSFLVSISPEMSQYTYPLLQSGVVDVDVLGRLTEGQLSRECCIDNSIHRLRILDAVKGRTVTSSSEDVDVNKVLDVFISYRRSNGSQLASLLKVHLQLKGFSVFIDVETLEAGKFDNNLLKSIRQAKNFLLVLTPSALDRCIGDYDQKDWVHREVVAALQSKCNIIPITDNFQWPEPEQLPDDMRAVSYFNGVRWIHDYQDACVEKLERFLKGEVKGADSGTQGRFGHLGGAGTPGTPSTGGRQATYVRSQSNESKGSVNSDKEAATVAPPPPLGDSNNAVITTVNSHMNGPIAE